MDLTVGSPLKRILVFMIPMIIGNVFQQLYSMVDTIIVGQALGANALAGVSFTGSITFLILGFVSGLTSGFSVVVSQRRGARDEDGMRRSFATGIVLTLIIVSALTVIAIFAAKPLLVAMNTNAEFLPYSLEYIIPIFGGMLLSALYNQFSATLRAIGDSVVPLYFLIFASILNGALDCLFVLALGMGASGAAIATVTSNGVSAALTFAYMWIKYPALRFNRKHFRPALKQYAAHIKLGLPMALQLSVVSIGMIFGQTALNTMNPVAQKTFAAASKIDGLATSIINSGGAAIATFVGQNYGAKRYDRIKSGVYKFTLFMVATCIVLAAIVLSLHRPLTMLFISKADRNEQMYGYALKYLSFNAGFYVLLATLCISRSALQGMGRGTLALSAAVAEVFMRVGVALIAIYLNSFTFVCMGNTMSWIGANIILIPAYLIVLHKYIPIIGKNGIRYFRMPNPSYPPKRR